MSEYRSPRYRSACDEPRYRVRCPVHGFIKLSRNERRLVDHRLVQRLRYIHQLALTQLVFPGAVHTRFEHSLGVMEMAGRLFDGLAARHGSQMTQALAGAPALADRPLAAGRQLVRLAALLHDVGHAPFSHTTEAVLCPEGGHEALTLWALEQTDLGSVVDHLFGEGMAQGVAALISGQNLPAPLGILRDIVSGQMDADRSDYLLRDSHHCGVEYGRFDVSRLVECIALRETEDGLQVALARDGLHAFEALILSRFQMTTQIYKHRLRRIYDHYLREYCRALRGELFATPGDVLAHHDVTVLARAFADAPGNTLARRIVERDHHRQVFSTGKGATDVDITRCRELHRALELRFPELELILDVTVGRIHAQAEGDDREHPLYLVGGGRPDRRVTRESATLRAIPQTFQTARIFADGPRPREWRATVTAYAADHWGALDGR